MTFGNPANQPGFQFDAPVSMINQNIAGGNTLILFPNTFSAGNTLFDVSQFESVILRYAPNGASVTINVTLQWFPYSTIPPGGSSIDSLGVDTFIWTSVDHTELSKTLPCRGNGLLVTVNRTGGIAANVDFMRLYGSNRIWTPLMGIPSDSVNNGANRVIASGNNVALATGGTFAVLPFTRYDGPFVLTVDCTGGATAQSIFGAVRDLQVGMFLAIQRDPGAVDSGTSRNEFTVKGVMTRNTCQVQLINLSGSNQSVQFMLIAAPEGT